MSVRGDNMDDIIQITCMVLLYIFLTTTEPRQVLPKWTHITLFSGPAIGILLAGVVQLLQAAADVGHQVALRGNHVQQAAAPAEGRFWKFDVLNRFIGVNFT